MQRLEMGHILPTGGYGKELVVQSLMPPVEEVL